jgi:hypothetical protein
MSHLWSRPLLVRFGRLFLLGVVVAACQGGGPVSPEALDAGARVEELFGALAVRFGAMRRDSVLEASRAKLVRYAFSPSRIYDDTTIWTGRGEAERSLVIAGRLTGDEYLLGAWAEALPPQHAGDMRASMSLRRISPSVFQWDTYTEMSAGALRAGDLAALLTPGGARPRSEEELRSAYRAALARSSAALGQLFDVDSVHVTPCADGATAVGAVLSFHPDRIADEYPGFAGYLTRYFVPARYRFALVDREGARWMLVSVGEGIVSFELRLHDGALAPLDAPPRPFPDSLQLRGAISMRGPLFTFGASDLIAELHVVRGSGQRGIALRFRDEPRWHFPLAVRHLIGGSLRRPFEGAGSELRIIAIEGTGAPMLLTSEIHTVVQESFIVRWLGGYGSSLLGALTPDVEREADRFLSELFAALEADLRQMREVTEE